MKACSVCRLAKSAEEFWKDSSAKDGLCSCCIACGKAKKNARYAETKHLRPKKVRKPPISGAESARRYREKYPEKVKEAQRIYDAARRQKKVIQDAERYARNREAAAKRYAAWAAANPENVRARAANRRARKKGAGGEHTQGDILGLLKLQKSKCAACKCCIKDAYEVDHITPIAKGGTNDKLNLQLLCPKCNRTKHAKDPIDFMQMKGYLL